MGLLVINDWECLSIGNDYSNDCLVADDLMVIRGD